MQVSHTLSAMSVSFDEENLVGVAGLVPVMALAREAGLQDLVDEWVKLPTDYSEDSVIPGFVPQVLSDVVRAVIPRDNTDKGANSGLKLSSLVGGMVAGAESIEDMDLLRHGAMKKLFKGCYAPSSRFLPADLHLRARQTVTERGHPLPGKLGQQDSVVGHSGIRGLRVHRH